MTSALTSVANVKSALGIPAGTTRHDVIIGLYVDGIDQLMRDAIGVPGFTSTDYTEWVETEEYGENMIRPSAWPITSIAAITDDGSLVAAGDYYISPDRSHVKIVSQGGAFTKGRRKVQITYTAGWTETEVGPMKNAAMLWAAAMFNQGAMMGLTQEQMGDRKVVLADQSMPAIVAAVLGRYQRAFP
jgi:hypothetical protein